jgi:hypothetical protein
MQANYSSELLLRTVDTKLLEHDIKLLHRLVVPHEAVALKAKVIDCEALNTENRRLFDNGDLLPAWAFWWLELAARVTHEACFWPCYALIVATPGKKSVFKAFPGAIASDWTVQSLDVSEMCVALANLSYPLGFIVAWGLQPQDINSPRFPLACRGFALPVIDGLGVLYRATPEEREWLKL